MNVFADISWDLPDMPGFLDDQYIQENSATYRLLNDQSKVPKNCRDMLYFDDQGGDDNCEDKIKDRAENADTLNEEPVERDPALRPIRYIAGLVKGLPFPRYSDINKREQALFLELQSKFLHKKLTLSSNVKPEEQQDFSMFITLNNKVMTERAEFLEFLKERWPVQVVKHKVISTEIEKYTTEAWKHRLQSRLDQLLPFYNKIKTIPLVYQGNKCSIQLEHSTLLIQMGLVPLIIHPKFQKLVQIHQDCGRLSKRFPPKCKDPDVDTSGTIHKLNVSEDFNAKQLARAYNVDVVISSSGLQTIANNHSDFKKGWSLPIVVKEYETVDDSGQMTRKRITFVDKALPPRTMNVIARNVRFHKYGVKALWCHSKHPNAFKFPYQGKGNKPVTSLKSSTNVTSSQDKLKSPEKVSKRSPTVHPTGKLARSSDESGMGSSDDEEMGLLIDTDSCGSPSGFLATTQKKQKERKIKERRSSRLIAKTSLGAKRVEEKVEELVNASFKKDGKSKDVQQSKSDNKEEPDGKTNEPLFTMPGPFNNVSYRLWNLKNVSDKDNVNQHTMMKQPAGNVDRDVKLLVRNKLDGILRRHDSIIPVCVIPKLEYQPEFGGEKLTREEATREWVSLMFRQQSILTRVRVNAETSEVLLMETRTMSDLVQDCKQACGHGFIPDVTSTLYSVLSGLVDLPPGQYLLSHTTVMGAFALLQQGNSEFGSVISKDMYSSVDPESAPVPEEIPWQEIDMNVQMPYHVVFNRVTGTYYPVHEVRARIARVPKKKIGPSKKLLKTRRRKRREVKAAREKANSDLAAMGVS